VRTNRFFVDCLDVYHKSPKSGERQYKSVIFPAQPPVGAELLQGEFFY